LRNSAVRLYRRVVHESEASLSGGRQFISKFRLIDVPGGFSEQQRGAWPQDAGSLGEEWTSGRHFVQHGKYKCEVDRACLVVEADRSRRNHARIDAIDQAGLASAALQTSNHPRLDIDSNNAPGCANEAGEFQGKEAPAGSLLEHRHASAHVWPYYRGRILHQSPEGGSEQIDPPRTNAMTRHTNLSETPRSGRR
jgi:hypothetical protein